MVSGQPFVDTRIPIITLFFFKFFSFKEINMFIRELRNFPFMKKYEFLLFNYYLISYIILLAPLVGSELIDKNTLGSILPTQIFHFRPVSPLLSKKGGHPTAGPWSSNMGA